MSAWRLLLLAATLAAIGGVVWWAVETRPLAVPDWEIEAENPLIIGTPEDPFAYAGGDSVESATGSARIAQAPGEETPTLHASISLPDGVGWPWDESSPGETETGAERTLRLSNYAHIEHWDDVAIHGESGLGDPRLPETYARLAGRGTLSLGTQGRTEIEDLRVFWTMAQAIRQQDGGIRQQGLTFSPLLRDKRGFSDPNRWELTILVYATADTAENRANEDPMVLLQIVYRTLILVPPDESD